MKRVKQFHYVFLLQAAGTALRSDSLTALRFSVFSEEDKSDAGERSSYAKIKYPSCRAGAHKKPAQSGTRGYTVKNTITFGNDSALVSLRNLCFDNTADVLAHDARFTPSHPQTQYAFKTVVFCKTNRLQ